MWWFCWSLTILCIFPLKSEYSQIGVSNRDKPEINVILYLDVAEETATTPSNKAEPKFTSESTAVIDFVVGTIVINIDSLFEALSLYDEMIDRAMPWKQFKESIADLDKFRNNFSTQNAVIIADIKVNILNAIDSHFHASQKVSECASFIASHLQLFIKFFNDHDDKKADTQKRLLIEVLDSTVNGINATETELEKISSNFNLAGEKLKTVRVENPSNNRNAMKFYENLCKKVQQARENTVLARKMLSKKIESIVNFKNDSLIRYVDLNKRSDLLDTIIEAAQALIAKCEKYLSDHNKID